MEEAHELVSLADGEGPGPGLGRRAEGEGPRRYLQTPPLLPISHAGVQSSAKALSEPLFPPASSLTDGEDSATLGSGRQDTLRHESAVLMDDSASTEDPADTKGEARAFPGTATARTRTPPKGLGLLLMVFASACLVAYSVAIKFLSAQEYRFTTFQLVFLRSVSTAAFAALALRVQRQGLTGPWVHDRGALRDLAIRAAAGFSSVSTTTWTTSVLPLGDGTVIGFLAPVFTGILAFFYLRETYEKTDVFAGLIALAGVVLVAKPPFLFPAAAPGADAPILADPESDAPPPLSGPNSALAGVSESTRVVATVMAIGAAFMAAVVSVQVRKMGKTIPALQIVFFYNISAGALCLIASLAQFRPWALPTDALSALLVLMLCICGFLQQWAFTKAMSLDKASKISSIGFSAVLFSFAADYLVFSRAPDKFALIGAACVGVAVAFIGVIKWKRGN